MVFDIKGAMSPSKAIYAASTRLEPWVAGKPLPPFAVELQPTDACTCACTYCSYSVRRGSGRAWPRGLFEDICEDLETMGVKAVYLSGGGEPTLSSYLPEAAKRLRAAGCALGLNTNGQDGDVVLGFSQTLSYILVHISDTSPERYLALMGEDNRGVRQLPARLRAAGNSHLVIGARVVVVDANVDHLDTILEDLHADGFSYVNLTLVRDFEGRGLDLDAHSLNVLALLEEHPLVKSGFAGINRQTTDGYKPAGACWSSELRMGACIAPTGETFLCVPDIGNVELSIGNVRKQRFRDIWNGERHKALIASLSERYRAEGCRNCRCIAYNREIEPLVASSRLPHREFV